MSHHPFKSLPAGVLKALAAIRWLAAFLLAASSAATSAQIQLTPDTERVELLGPQVSYLRDRSGSLGIDEVKQRMAAGEFSPLKGNLGLGYTSDVVWLAVTLTAPQNEKSEWILVVEPPTLNYIDFFKVDGLGVERQQSGDRLPFSQRSSNQRTHDFRFTVEGPGETQIFLRIDSPQAAAVLTLWSPKGLEQQALFENFVFGIYFGGFAIIFLYNLMLALSLRSRRYWLYCCVVATHTVLWFTYDGFVGLYFLPEQPGAANTLLVVVVAMTLLAGNYFYADAMGLHQKVGLLQMLLRGCYLVLLLTALESVLGVGQVLLPWSLGANVLVTILLALKAIKIMAPNGDPRARVFAISYLVYFPLSTATVLANLSVLPTSELTLYLSQVAQFVHVLTLHFVMFYDLRRTEVSKEQAERAFLLADAERIREHEINLEQQQMLEVISHEVRTPIAVIRSAVESLALIDKDAVDSGMRTKRYARIAAAVSRIKSLVSTVELGQEGLGQVRSQPQLQPVDLVPLIKESIAFLTDSPEDLKMTLPSNLPQVVGDREMLKVAIENLIGNALKHRDPAAPVCINLSVLQDSCGTPSSVMLSVCNRVLVTTQDMTTRMFEKYVRLNESSGVPGLGLGLNLARRIAVLHEGSLEASLVSANEICLQLTLPIAGSYSE